MFIIDVYCRIALIDIPRASVITKKNQRRMISFHLYFISKKIKAKARANAKMIEKNPGVGSSSGVWSPNGREPSVIMISCSPVSGLMIVRDSGAYVLTTKSPMNCVARNMLSRINVMDALCFMAPLVIE